jgi:sn-glycerol 3-phosphate transport system ATP-binding protein
MASISIREMTKRFGQLEVLHSISAEINDGEFLVVVGPSGCGKSTILRLIAGLEEITSGEVWIGEQLVNSLEPKDRNIAMVFQNYALYPHMNVFNNMAYGLRTRRFSTDEIRQRVEDAARTLGLENLLDRKPRQLSGGQRQRVAMGRCIVREPSVFLFDEPLSNLDAKLRTQMRVELKRLHKQLRTTSIYVTHDQVEAMTLADRILVLNEGRIEHLGTADEIYHRPATTFVAGFIGSPGMNLLPGRLAGDGDMIRLPDGNQCAIPRGMNGFKKSGITLGLRPEHLTLKSNVTEPDPCCLKALVELVEPLGSDNVAHCSMNGISHNLVARLPSNCPVTEGETLDLAFHPGNLHLFDPENGARIQL